MPALHFELARAVYVRITQTRFPPCRGDTPLQVADERFLIDATAVSEGVAVEDDIAGDGTALEPAEQMPREFVRRCEQA